MMQKSLLVFFTALFTAAASQAGEIVVQEPPPLPGVYGGGVATDCQPPAYPIEARRYELEGKTIVELLIGDDGGVHGQRIAKSSGWKILDQETLSYMTTCRFSPITRDGQPAGAHWKKFAFVWRLEDSADKQASAPLLLRASCAGAERLTLVDDPFHGDGVLMRFLTSTDGVAFGVKIEKGTGDAGIDNAAAQLLQSCKFTPSMRAGAPGPGHAYAWYRPGTND